MAITSVGYDGSVSEAQWAKMIPLVGTSHYGVAGSGDWKVTAHATLDRGVSIATGTGWGMGVMDTSDATVSLQAASIGSGSRWDMVVARRNWSGTGGTTTFAIIGGSSAKALPSRNTNEGTLDDQPLALVQFTAGSTAATAIIDLRCWGRNGGMTARDELVLTYLKQMGTSIVINGTTWCCTPNTNGSATWTATTTVGTLPLFGASKGALSGGGTNAQNLVDDGQPFLIQAGTTVNTTDGAGYARITFQNPFPGGLLSIMATDGDGWASTGAAIFSSAGTVWGAEGFGTKASWVYGMSVQPAAGNANSTQTFTRAANRQHRVNWIAIGW